VLPSQIIVTNGVTALLDILPFNLADEGEGIMYPTPIYGMFNHDIVSRNSLHIVEVPTESLPDQFLSSSAPALIAAFEDAYLKALKSGIRIRAVVICNPCNPLGRCYSRETLVEIARFCGRYGLHLVADEIYALSSFEGGNEKEEEEKFDSFTSVLTLGARDEVDMESIHVLYGVAKDFGMGGLRLGFLITRDELVWKCVRKLWY